jgi:hypothetical protein
VVFKEVERKSEFEVMVQTQNNPEKVWFELRNEEGDSDESNESYEHECHRSSQEIQRLTGSKRIFLSRWS